MGFDFSHLSGGTGWVLLAGGAAIGWVKNFWQWINQHTIGQVTRRIMVSVTIEESEHTEAWLWVQFWAEHKLRSRRIAWLRLHRKRRNRRAEIEGEEDEDLSYELLPADGTYPFFWKGKLLVINSGTEEKNGSPGGSMADMMRIRRKVTIEVWFTREREMLLSLIEEARCAYDAAHPATQQYYFHRWSYWNSKPLARRNPESVYLPEGLFEEILADAERFLGEQSSFMDLGIPWRRGYLFYGPPGGGKTTTVIALATALGRPLYYLSLASVRSRDDLSTLLDDVRPGAIVLVEDVDCVSAAVGRMNAKDDDGEKTKVGSGTANSAQDRLTASDLLNQIDGVVASEGRLLVMTTNYPEKLDAALTRPGRVDRKWEIGYARRPELVRFFERASNAGVIGCSLERFLGSMSARPTIAEAQAFAMGHHSRAEEDEAVFN